MMQVMRDIGGVELPEALIKFSGVHANRFAQTALTVTPPIDGNGAATVVPPAGPAK